MRLLVADDHTLFRDALVQYIERSDPDCKVSLAKDFYEAMDLLAQGGQFDLVILDLRMPGMKGMGGFNEIKAKFPNVRVALMSGVAEAEDVQKALEAGAVGYFPKTMSGKALLVAIRHVVEGNAFVPKDTSTAKYMPSYYDDEDYSVDLSDAEDVNVEGLEDVHLTPRESEVLSYLVDGSSNKEIARALDLQVVTVKLHVRGICRKLNAKNRTQAALKARALGVKSAAE